jgi:hypothetical protein
MVPRTFASHRGRVAFDCRVHRSVVNIRHLGDAELKRVQRGSNASDVVMRVFERAYPRIAGLNSRSATRCVLLPGHALPTEQSTEQRPRPAACTAPP